MFAKLTDFTQVTIFCTVTVLLSFVTYLLPLPREVLPFLIVLLPTLIALGLTAVSEGGAGVRSLLGKLGQWRISLKWLIIALGLALLMRLAISVLALWFGLIPAIQVRPGPPSQLLLLAVIVTIAALLEEIGWRGYALPKLLAQHSPLSASLIIGVVWGSLHLALLLPGMMNAGAPALPTVVAVASVSVLTTWLYVNTGGNLILAIVFHAAQNFFVIVNEGIPFTVAAWLMVGVYLTLVLIVITLTGWKLTKQPAVSRKVGINADLENQPCNQL
jgi:membrane protease YdiL (CAAX protease family)